MNAKQEAKLTMYRGIEQHLDTNSAIIATIAALATAFDAFKAIVVNILNTTQLANVNLAGITTDKSNAKQILAQIAADIAAIIAAFASATANPTLRAEVNYSLTKLLKARDEMLAPLCRIILDRAIENRGELEDYGITPAKITDLRTAIENYNAKTPNPRSAVSNRKTQTANISEFFKQGDAILKNQIDALMKNFRTTNPEFHETYFNLREIPDAPTTATQLKGIVTDASDAKPLKGATVTIVNLNKTTSTDSAGKYSFKPVEHGKHTVTVGMEGYQSFENDEIEVKLGDIRHLNVELVSN
jgi:cob(I)alamin adenosyltransferase